MASIFLRVAQAHLGPKGHPDTMIGHWEYLGRTKTGSAVLVVEETKLGRTMSVVHISLHQDGLLSKAPWVSPDSRREVTAYITNCDLTKEKGVSLPTNWTVSPAPPPVNFSLLLNGQDPYWQRYVLLPIMNLVPIIHHVEFYYPRTGRPSLADHDLWMRLANGEKFKQTDLGFIVDASAPFIVEGYRREDPDMSEPEESDSITLQSFWYPTLTLNLDVKKRLPQAGSEWLRLRQSTKQIRHGRLDLEFLVFDTAGELVAISHHVAMAVDSARNYAARKPSKI